MNTCMRVYTNSDVRGVEICGAMKNIIALAAGISDGLGYGDNAKAAIITRGIAEISRLGAAMGCRESTFSGLAGLGDLVVTCTSRHSRNNRAGRMMGEGLPVEEALRQVGMVVEGRVCPARRDGAFGEIRGGAADHRGGECGCSGNGESAGCGESPDGAR